MIEKRRQVGWYVVWKFLTIVAFRGDFWRGRVYDSCLGAQALHLNKIWNELQSGILPFYCCLVDLVQILWPIQVSSYTICSNSPPFPYLVVHFGLQDHGLLSAHYNKCAPPMLLHWVLPGAFDTKPIHNGLPHPAGPLHIVPFSFFIPFFL